MITKTQVKQRTVKKTNSELVETINMARKNDAWEAMGVAAKLSMSTRKMAELNLSNIDKHSEEGDTVVVPGKVLGTGNINKKIKVIAMSFSQSAREKLKQKKCETASIIEEINKNPKATGLRMII
jgi:large subunit ribosomal protein L18e